MGVKAELKAARARMQAGEPAEALAMTQTILDGGSPDLQEAQTMYAVLVTAGLAGLAAGDLPASEVSFRRAGECMPDAPQAWKGLIDCLDRAGKTEALPECLSRAAEIAERKGNYSRARTLRLRHGEVLDTLGRPEEALEALLRYLDDPAAAATTTTGSSGNPVGSGAENEVEALSLLLLAAVLEVSLEDDAISQRVEKRLLKDKGIASSTTAGATAAAKSRSALEFEYRGKVLAKDDEAGGPVSKRLAEATRALREAAAELTVDDPVHPHHTPAWRALVTRFCRAVLGRAIQRAEHKAGGSSLAAWEEPLAACATVTEMIGDRGWDDGWVATVTLMSSSYNRVDASELFRVASAGADDSTARPWLSAEARLHLAGVALSAGDSLEADALLKAAAAARGKDSVAGGGCSQWVGMSGPGSEWRELSLRSLANEALGYPGASRDPRVALALVDTAVREFEASCRARGEPTCNLDLRGGLALARAPLLMRLGRADEARSAVEKASLAAIDFAPSATSPSEGEVERPTPRLHLRVLCVAADLDAAAGDIEAAKGKLEEVLEADPGFACALSRLGWLLLGGGCGEGGEVGGGGNVGTAMPLLERAAVEEPGSSSHAFRLARCYWEAGGEHRSDRRFCFNALLKAAKLNPSNAQAFEWLGHWYEGVGGDSERARGCFQRAVKLDPETRGAGEALALLYLESGQETLAVALFRQCAAVSVACHWAWAGLGRVRILEEKLAEAASHIQQAIRGCPTSWSYWSDLGWCYHAEGKQAAALKAYTRAQELLAGEGGGVGEGSGCAGREAELAARVRVMTQIGTIQRSIGQVDESVGSFTDALALDPNSGLALSGAGEACLAQAHARTSEGLYTAAVAALQRGCVVTRRFLGIDGGEEACSTEGSGDKEGAWKLLGDLHTYGHKLSPYAFPGGGGAGALGLGSQEAAAAQLAMATEGSRSRLEFVGQGEDAYQKLVELLMARPLDETSSGSAGSASAHLAPALYDLGLNFLVRSTMVSADAGEGSGLWPRGVYEDVPEVSKLARLAEKTFKQALEADPSHSDSWNGLGAVSRDPLVQQHCWVRAVQLAHNPSAWANLGMLYLRWGLDVQAYESFGGLQAVTDHPVMWVGLGLLKEKEACQPGVTAAKRRKLLSRASDAYYSTLETGQHVDGLLGLGTTAGRTHSQADALVSLQQYLDLNPSSAQAWNHLGSAAELAGRGTQAVAAYRRALGLLEDQGARFLGQGEDEDDRATSLWEQAVALTRANLGRTLVREGEGEEAVQLLGGSAPKADNLLQLGRAHATLGDWNAALAVLEQAASAEGTQGVGRAISDAAVRFRKGDTGGAVEVATVLIERHPTNRRVLHTALSLGALAANAPLVKRACRSLQTLPKRSSASDPDGHRARNLAEEALWASHLAMRAAGAPDTQSRRELCKAVHTAPSSIRSWTRLGAFAADSATGADRSSLGHGNGTAPGCEASADLARVCIAAAEKQATFSLLGKARDPGGSVAGREHATAAAAELEAAELGDCLVGVGNSALCGGKVGSAAAAVKATVRAVHLYPGESAAWRCLGAALVARALSSSSETAEGRTAALIDANVIYRGVADASSASSHPHRREGGMAALETNYSALLLSATQGTASSRTAKAPETPEAVAEPAAAVPSSSDSLFAAGLHSARTALSGEARPDAIAQYKRTISLRPRALAGWRELAASFELSGQLHASEAALQCGARAACPGKQKGSAGAAPLHLQEAGGKLLTARAEESLAPIGDAFRVGKGGAVGHVLRGLINVRLGKAALATQAFGKAKLADPGIAAFVDELAGAEEATVA